MNVFWLSDVCFELCRIAELNRKRELNAAAELKRMEIALAHKYARQALLAKFLRTAAQPPLFWRPAKHCADTILLEEQRQLDLSVWLVGTLQSTGSPNMLLCHKLCVVA